MSTIYLIDHRRYTSTDGWKTATVVFPDGRSRPATRAELLNAHLLVAFGAAD